MIEIVAFTADLGMHSWGQCDVRRAPHAGFGWMPLAFSHGEDVHVAIIPTQASGSESARSGRLRTRAGTLTKARDESVRESALLPGSRLHQAGFEIPKRLRLRSALRVLRDPSFGGH